VKLVAGLPATERGKMNPLTAEPATVVPGVASRSTVAAVLRIVAPTMGAFLPGLYLPPESGAVAIVIMVAAGIAAGIFPALKAMRLSIVDALAHG
jgi:ABC-type lipoprotein release transport system permease subunit